ncbi:hypothetical protein NM688_g6524 [Phlebia brevispora]|uniref:Uncharacterized protein n=1 Tax=Phlebia brevispora TaxID=194682 RepID=A0ACC1SF78_9APHY|nr:hypothetical protein NM688_g6524 [Phlebia brevispora]
MTDIFSWQHINYTIPLGGGKHKELLEDVSGYVAPGKLTALMGLTGAGKTTLLNVLAQRTLVGVVTGDRFVNGHAPPRDFQAQTGYCQQADTHVPTLTVRESLLFSARLRQPKSVPDSEKEAYVEKCLEMCGLTAFQDAVVGSLNTEYRKRTTIAVELAAKACILRLILILPTSGLDSQTAWAIMAFVRSLADNGLSILCTIHQPSAVLFQLFDRLLLLQPGGQTVYFGDIGQNSSTLLNYFERNGAAKCRADENPAEYMLTAIGPAANAKTHTDWHVMWEHSPEAATVQDELDKIHAEGRSRPPVAAAQHKEFATPWVYQTKLLFQRDCLAHWRNPTYLLSKIVLNIAAGLFIGFTFFKSKDSLQGTQNKLFAIFMSTIVTVALAHQLQIPFIDMRDVYEVRERPSRMYSWTALITSQILAELPWNVLGSTLFFLCWFWTVGFASDRAGFTYFMYCVVNPMYYTTIGQAIAAMSSTAEIAALLFSFFFSFVIAFNGVLQPFRALGWWRWMYRVSTYTYVVEAIYGQAIGHQPIRCGPVEYVQVDPPTNMTCYEYMQPFINVAGGYITNPNATAACDFCPYSTTDAFMGQNFNIYYDHHWRNLGLLFVYIGFNVGALFVLTYIFRIKFFNPFAWIGWLRRRLARLSVFHRHEQKSS